MNNQERQSSEEAATVVTKIYGTYNEFALNVYRENDIVSGSILSSGSWENDKVVMFHRIFQDYSEKNNIPLSKLTFIDIGANIGWFTFSLAALGVNVIAFEPMEENIKLIRDSMCLPENLKSGVSSRITLHEHALGVRDEMCYIFSHNINIGDGHVKCIGANETDLTIPFDYSIKGHIPVRRLDDIIDAKGKHIVALKMDTEGYEANVLQGGKKLLLHGGIDVIVTEFAPDWIREKGTFTPEMFMQELYDAGYRPVNEWSTGYMDSQEILDMSQQSIQRDLVLHSLSFRNSQAQH
jgi:FkbM family methyltransferase